MKKRVIFKGVGTALVTPFSRGRIDYPTFDRLIERQIDAKIDALVIGGTFVVGEPLIGLPVAAVFIIEMLSSFLQGLWFKLTRKFSRDKQGKRLFRMAPLHHHFEKCGWSEYKVVAVFSLVQLLFCVLAWFGI